MHKEGFQPEERSGSLSSPLNKVLQKDTRIPKEKMWVKDLINEIPYRDLPMVTEFLQRVPPEKAEEVAEQLFKKIKEIAGGILHSDDPEATLREVFRQIENRLEN